MCYDLKMCCSCPDITLNNVMPVMLKFISSVCCEALLSCECIVRSDLVILWQVNRPNYRGNSVENLKNL